MFLFEFGLFFCLEVVESELLLDILRSRTVLK